MAGPKNPEQLRGALGAFRRRLQEAETPKPSVDMKLDTGLDPSKAPVPVRPQFQAPMIPETPTEASPYKGVEDVANRVLNAPVGRRQFLEGARSGVAALSQLGKLGQLGKLLPENPVDMRPYYGKALKRALDRSSDLPGFQNWTDFLDPYVAEDYRVEGGRDRMQAFSELIEDELGKIMPRGGKSDPEILDQMLFDLQRANDKKRRYETDVYDTDEMIYHLGGDSPTDFSSFARRILQTPYEDEVRPPSPLTMGSDEDVLGTLRQLGMHDSMKEMWQNAIEAYMDEVPSEKWPDWIRNGSWMKD